MQKMKHRIITYVNFDEISSDVVTRLSLFQLGELGGGAGKGGGGGGSVREAGGAFGKRAAVEEERYFR